MDQIDRSLNQEYSRRIEPLSAAPVLKGLAGISRDGLDRGMAAVGAGQIGLQLHSFERHMHSAAHTIFRAACSLGHEGIVAKRKDLPYESGRSKRWVKVKNPDGPAMKRVVDETL
jgi:hypothetical protein